MQEQIKVPITFEMIAMAKAHRASIDRIHGGKGLFNGGNRWIGELGQLLFREWLVQNNIKFKEDRSINRPDKYDFYISHKSVNVKTCYVGSPLLIPEQHLKRSDLFLFIRISKDLKFGYLLGWISKEDVSSYAIDLYLPNPAVHVPQRDLKSLKIPPKEARDSNSSRTLSPVSSFSNRGD